MPTNALKWSDGLA